ncbi:MAG TPA: glycine cleavage system protein R [Chromatiaceae bacterium]|nr:glycine cleavage system protein R [Chromatiaceae bacterium]
MNNSMNQLVLSALGRDRPGIVDELSKAIFLLDCSISDSRMTVLGGEFAILLLVEGPWNQLARLESQIPELEKNLDLTIIARQTAGSSEAADALPYLVEVVSLDNPGIVHKLANFFSQRDINIMDLTTSSYAAPHTGTPMFAVQMNIGVPVGSGISELRDEFLEFCDSINLDAVLEPYKKSL